MVSSEHILEHAAELLRRVSPEARRAAQRRRTRRRKAFFKRVTILVAAALAIMIGLATVGLFIGPVGTTGLMIAGLMIALVALALTFAGGEAEPDPKVFANTDLAQLPSRTEDWLEKQRPALPAPAQRHLDAISLRLEALGPQLQLLDPREPAALEVRRLLADELPELVRGYRRVPEALRREPLDGGRTPNAQLVEGLGLIDEEIGRMTGQLASGDLKALATQQRFLEIKYRGDGGMGTDKPA